MPKAISSTMRKRLDIQGMCDVPDATIAEVTPWHRFPYVLCGTIAGLGTALANPTLLFALVPIGVLAAIFPVHPFDLIYNHGIRYIAATGPLPKRAAPVRFACGVGAAWLTATALCFQSGFTLAGYILGGIMFLMAALVSTTDICIASMIYRALPFTANTPERANTQAEGV